MSYTNLNQQLNAQVCAVGQQTMCVNGGKPRQRLNYHVIDGWKSASEWV